MVGLAYLMAATGLLDRPGRATHLIGPTLRADNPVGLSARRSEPSCSRDFLHTMS